MSDRTPNEFGGTKRLDKQAIKFCMNLTLDGRKKTEIFEMTHDRKRLYVLVTLEGYGKMSGVTFKRVYEPEPSPVPAAPAAPAAVAPAQPTEPSPPGRSWDEDDYDGDDFEFA